MAYTPFRTHGDTALTAAMCYAIVSHMRSTTIRELKHATSTVLGWVAAGESVEVRRREKLVAVLSPPLKKAIKKPDFAARLHGIYGSVILPATATDIISESRGET